jgi:NAD(P)-dependent dehydrogenase (short-subunit alcohol dehydrogenase family)
MHRLDGKVIIVAGGGSGIGAASAKRLASEGAAVVVGDINLANAEAVAQQIASAGGKAEARAFDMRDEASIEALVAATVKAHGGLDGIHVNAGDMGAVMHDKTAVDVELEIFDRTIAVNLRGHLLCTRHAVPAMLARGGGAIVYTSSLAAYIGENKRVAYAASKAGVNALARHVASRWGRENIRANAIAPGMVATENNSAAPPERMEKALRGTRSTRLGRPEDIAAMVAMLMSSDGEWINGQVIAVDGGATLRA